MVNTEKLLAYVEAAGTTWEALTADIGGIPSDLHEFAELFERDASVNTLATLIDYLNIPAADVGLVFFAPVEFDENEEAHLTELEDPEDVIVDRMRGMHSALKEEGAELFRIFSMLGVRERHDLMSAAFELEEKAGAAGRTAAE